MFPSLLGLRRSNNLLTQSVNRCELCGSACGMPVSSGQANSRRRELVTVAFRFGSMPKNEQCSNEILCALADTVCKIVPPAPFCFTNPAGGARKKHLLWQVLFSMKRTLRCMKNEAGLRPIKRAFGTRRTLSALRFIFAKQMHHASVASASYRRKPMLH